jgi:cytochrome c oxidase subunit IV
MREAELEEQRTGRGHAVRYVVVWAMLLVLTATTYLTSRADLGSWNIVLALIIAGVKAGLVALFFMHLSEQQGVNRMVFVVSLAFVALLIGLAVTDLATRTRTALPPGYPEAPPDRQGVQQRGHQRQSGEQLRR